MPPNDGFDRTVILTTNETQHTTRVVAKTFYKIMRKNGFTTDQIIGVSTAILDHLLESMNGHKHSPVDANPMISPKVFPE